MYWFIEAGPSPSAKGSDASAVSFASILCSTVQHELEATAEAAAEASTVVHAVLLGEEVGGVMAVEVGLVGMDVAAETGKETIGVGWLGLFASGASLRCRRFLRT